jgi:hypothetical protein
MGGQERVGKPFRGRPIAGAHEHSDAKHGGLGRQRPSRKPALVSVEDRQGEGKLPFSHRLPGVVEHHELGGPTGRGPRIAPLGRRERNGSRPRRGSRGRARWGASTTWGALSELEPGCVALGGRRRRHRALHGALDAHVFGRESPLASRRLRESRRSSPRRWHAAGAPRTQRARPSAKMPRAQISSSRANSFAAPRSPIGKGASSHENLRLSPLPQLPQGPRRRL